MKTLLIIIVLAFVGLNRGEVYCGYYDVFTFKCEEVKECPDGLDGDEDEDEDEYVDEEDITDSDIEYY